MWIGIGISVLILFVIMTWVNIYSLLLVSFAVYRYAQTVLFYLNNRYAVINLEESGIHYKNKNEEKYLAWDDITRIKYIGLLKSRMYHNYFILKSESDQIIIGEYLTDSKSFVKFLKNKVADRFNTEDIPYGIK